MDAPYLGDQAQVLPSNTPALMHFSSEFAMMNARRQQQQLMQQRADEQMKNRVNSSINSQIFNPAFLKTDASNPQLSKMMSDASGDVLNTLRTQGEEAAYQKLHDWSSKIADGSQVLKQAHAAALYNTANYAKEHPGIDQEGLYNAYLHKAFFNDNPDGSSTAKDLTDLNPYQNYLPDVIKEHGQDLYSEQSANDALNKDIKALSGDNIKVPSNIDTNGNIISRGYSATKFPSKALDIIPDGKGGFTTRLKSQDYSLDGKNPYIDENGKTIKVLPDDLNEFFANNDAIAAKAERMTRQNLSDINATGQQIDRDSPYGQMLYKKNLYDIVNGSKLNGGFSVNPDNAEKQAQAIKNKNFSQAMQQAHLNISQNNSNLSNEKFQYQKNKDNFTNPDGTPYQPTFDKLVSNAKPSEFNSFNGGNTKIVDVTDMDKDKYNELAGTKSKVTYDKDGKPVTTSVGGVMPLEANGRKFLIVNPQTGNLEGAGGTIERDAAIQREISKLPKGKSAPIYQRAVNAVKSAMSKIPGIKKGALN